MLHKNGKRMRRLMRQERQVKVMIKQRRTIFEDGMPEIPAPEFEFITDDDGEKYFEAYFFFDEALGGAPQGGWLWTTPDGITLRIELMLSEDLINWTSQNWLESPLNGQVIDGQMQYRARSKFPASSINKISILSASGPNRSRIYDPVLYPPESEYPNGVGPNPNPIATSILTIRLDGVDLALPNAPYQMPGAAATLQADLVALGFSGSVVSGGTVDGEQWDVYIPSVLVSSALPQHYVTFPPFLTVNDKDDGNVSVISSGFTAASINTAGIRTDTPRQFVRLKISRVDDVALPGDLAPPASPVIPNPEFGITLDASAFKIVAGGETTLDLVTDDRIEDVTTNTVVTTHYQLTPTRTGSEVAEIVYTSSDTNVATVDANGLVSYVSSGSVVIYAVHGPALAQVILSMDAPKVTRHIRIYKRGADGSPRLASEQAVDTRLAGKSKALACAIFTTQTGTVFVRNPDFWGQGLTGLTGISPWNSSGGTTRAVTAITRRHITMAQHFQMGVGGTCKFVTADNTVITRTLVAKISLATDITIGLLDSDLPAEIEPVRMLPVDWETYFPTGLEHIPALCLDQEEKGLVTDCNTAGLNLTMQVPSDAKRLEFYESKIVGDSGNPAGIIINDSFVMLTQWWFGGPGSGPFLPNYRTEIEAAITALGAFGHALVDVEFVIPFDPLPLSPALWLSDTGTNPAQWDDLSGNSRHALQAVVASQPAILTNSLNGRQVRSFDVGDWMKIAASGSGSLDDLTMIAVHQYNTLGSSSASWEMVCAHGVNVDATPSGILHMQRILNTNSIGMHNAGVANTGVSVNTGSGGLLVPRITMVRRAGGTSGNGGAVTVRSNNLTSTGTQTWTTSVNTTSFKIGGRQQAITEYFKGAIAEVLVFSRAISDVEANSLFAALSDKYTIPIV